MPDYRLPKRVDRNTVFSTFRSYSEDADGWLVAIEYRAKNGDLWVANLHDGKKLAVFPSRAAAMKAIEPLAKRIKDLKT